MNFLADENVDQQIVDQLRKNGHNVLYVIEMEPGISDDEVLARANRRGALLLTADKDFGELIFRQQRISSGVILIRLAGLSPIAKVRVVASAIQKHGTKFINAFTVITAGLIRIRPKT